jgi:mannose-6-phosphate isomerase-like protein (cupin superfamily)
MEIHHLPSLRKPGETYLEFLRTRALSAGVYRLTAGATDGQQPHGEEEIYFVAAGRAGFVSGARDVMVQTGDILFVPANEPHKFHDIAEDLELLVFFAPAEGTGQATS